MASKLSSEYLEKICSRVNQSRKNYFEQYNVQLVKYGFFLGESHLSITFLKVPVCEERAFPGCQFFDLCRNSQDTLLSFRSKIQILRMLNLDHGTHSD